ncbi:MAG: IS110 family transposase [Terracidiphilus sp.]|jgi:transposase
MSKQRNKVVSLPVIEPNAAGIDIGATEIFVAVPADRAPEPIRCFPTFTVDLEKLADWLQQCQIRTVAMESTGVYWIPLSQILEKRKIDVRLVNARHVKNVPGRKTDVSDCQWIQHLHSVGLLRGSFRPDDEICPLRSLWRHRDNLIQLATLHLQHMQKALDQMNLQLHHVISDLAGTTGLAIMDAILAGERNPQKLAQLRNRHIQASEETIMKSLVGDYREEHLFTLRQSLRSYRHYQELIQEVDLQVKQMLRRLPSKTAAGDVPPKGDKIRRTPWRNEPPQLRNDLYRAFGVDLTEVPGINSLTAQMLLTEIGPNLSRFPTAAAFCSWLRLCPNPKISGGQVLSSRTQPTKNRAALALRMATQGLHRSDSFLGDYFRRMKARMGAPKAMTATAHKLARIVYHMVTTQQEYDATVFQQQELRRRLQKSARLYAQARELGFHLVPIDVVP